MSRDGRRGQRGGSVTDEFRRYLEWRIRCHSGGEELKSMAESSRDEIIVKELQDALDVLDGKLPHRREGNRPFDGQPKWKEQP